jgi:hypothetical protein
VPNPPIPGQTIRTVFTKLGEKKYSHRVDQDRGKGFAPVWEKICTKR